MIALLMTPGVAAGQSSDDEGSGLELSPAVSVSTLYRSNVYLQEGSAGGGEETTSGVSLKLNPTLEMKLKNSDLDFDLEAAYTARRYLNKELQNLNRYQDASLKAAADVLPTSIVGARVTETFKSVGRESEGTYAEHAYVRRNSNNVGGHVSVHPGGALTVNAGGRYQYVDYSVPEDSNAEGSPSLNNKNSYGPAADLKWRFLPKTAVVANYAWYAFDWENNILDARLGDFGDAGDFGEFIGVPDGRAWKANAGIRGRITEKLVIGLVGGYGASIYDETSVTNPDSVPDGFDSTDPTHADDLDVSQGFGTDLQGFPGGLLMSTDVTYQPSEGQSFSLGYIKDFQDVYFTNYVSYDHMFLRYQGLLADRVGLKAETSSRFEQYFGEVNRSDMSLSSKLEAAYRSSDILHVETGVNWVARRSLDGNADVEYDDVRVNLGVTLMY
ncbi:MAG: hypothetical protein QGG40_09065, partial [Myxococcota bacterium]|nr:hypothetical protein [Myxococcota bacterium]